MLAMLIGIFKRWATNISEGLRWCIGVVEEGPIGKQAMLRLEDYLGGGRMILGRRVSGYSRWVWNRAAMARSSNPGIKQGA